MLDHLLRTFASVPFGNRVLDLNCGDGRRALPLVQLGFDVYACDPAEGAVAAARRAAAEPLGEAEAARRITVAGADALGYPDAFFDWVVAFDVAAHVHTEAAVLDTLAEVRRVLRDGGWVYVTVPAVDPAANPLDPAPGYAGDSGLALRFTPETLGALMTEAGFAEAQAALPFDEDGRAWLQAIYRRVDAHTPK